jgi:hypothetical protein
MFFSLPWRIGKVVIATAYRTEDPGFKSRQGVRFLGIYTLQCCCHMHCHCVYWRKKCLYISKKFLILIRINHLSWKRKLPRNVFVLMRTWTAHVHMHACMQVSLAFQRFRIPEARSAEKDVGFSRVTRLGEFSPFEAIVYFRQFF